MGQKLLLLKDPSVNIPIHMTSRFSFLAYNVAPNCMVGGPTFESIAEGRALRTLGADAVGEWQLVLSRSMAVGMYVNNTDGECGWRLAG